MAILALAACAVGMSQILQHLRNRAAVGKNRRRRGCVAPREFPLRTQANQDFPTALSLNPNPDNEVLTLNNREVLMADTDTD